MDDQKFLAERFEADRRRLRGIAYRMLGALSEAEDAVQEAWLRLARSGVEKIDNLSGWLTIVVARVCLDMLRARKARREEPQPARLPEPAVEGPGADPEQEALLADAVGLALLVVLDRLAPAERIAFVLHDLFDLPFEDIARIVDRSPEATRQLASRARRRVRGAEAAPDADRARQRAVVEAFLAASRDGDLDGLLALLDPGVIFRADPAAQKMGSQAEMIGAEAVARAFKGRARAAQPARIGGSAGLLVVLGGRLRLALAIRVTDGRIVEIEAIADPARLAGLDLAVLDD